MPACMNVVPQWAQAEVCTHVYSRSVSQVWLSVSNGSNKIHPHQEDRQLAS